MLTFLTGVYSKIFTNFEKVEKRKQPQKMIKEYDILFIF